MKRWILHTLARLPFLLLAGSLLFCSPLKGQEIPDSQLLYNLARGAFESGNHELSIDYAEQALILLLGTEAYEELTDQHILLARNYLMLNQPGAALKSFFQAQNAIEKSGDRQSLGAVFTQIGLLYEGMKLPEKAIEYYRQAYDIREEFEDPEGKMDNLEQLGRSYLAQDSLEKALNYYSQLLDLNREEGDTRRVIYSLRKMVNIYKGLDQPNKALGHNQEILELAMERGDSVEIAAALNNLGISLSILNDHEKALSLFLQTLTWDRSLQRPDTALMSDYINIGITYQNLGKPKQAIEHLLQGLNLIRDKGLPHQEARMQNVLAMVYLQQSDYHNAKVYCQAAIEQARESRSPAILRDAYQTYAQIMEEGNDFEQALKFYQQYLQIRDSLLLEERLLEQAAAQQQFSMEKTERDLRLFLAQEEMEDLEVRQILLEQEKREQELELLRRESEIAALALKQEETEKDRAIKALELAQQRIEAERREQEIRQLQQNKELQALTLRQRDQEARLQRNAIELQETQLKEQAIRLQAQQRQRTYLGFILILVLIVLALMIVSYWQKQKAGRKLERQKAEIEVNKEELEQALANLTRTHQQLQNAQTQLVEAEKMASLGQLTAGIAHEINNPINFVSSNISPLKQDFAELQQLFERIQSLSNGQSHPKALDEIQRYIREMDADYLLKEVDDLLQGIEEGANRTKEIVVGLRNFSRMDEAEFKDADIHLGLDSTLTLLSNRTRNKILVHKTYGDLPLIHCLPGKLNQVFMNILTNAIQAVDPTGNIWIQTEYLTQPTSQLPPSSEGFVQIRIKDDGQGMDEKTQSRIFDPFFTTKEVGKGTGLGLSITYGIIEQHKGRISVESAPGMGATFTITLPVRPYGES